MYNQQLNTLITVADSGSFSKAAEMLYVSPTAVMKQINSLESHLQVALFERTNHGLKLTAAGESIYRDAKYLVEYSDRAIEKARKIQDDENRQTIRVGISFMTPAKFVVDTWAKIQATAPSMKIELIPFENTPKNAVEILKNLGQQIDIVFGIYDDWLKESRGFQTLHLYDKKLQLTVPIASPLAEKPTIEPTDLLDCGVYLIKPGFNRYIDEMRELLEQADVPIKDFEFFNVDAYNRAAVAETPIIAIDEWENIHPLLTLKEVSWHIGCPFGLMYSLNPSKLVSRFVSMIDNMINP